MNEEKSTLPSRDNRFSPQKNEEKNSLVQEILSTLVYIIIISSVFFVIQRYFYAPVMVDGDSMEETLSDGDYLLLNRFSEIERFDVVIFPENDLNGPVVDDQADEKLYVKRVIGVAGDRIEYKGDSLYLNGEEMPESYLDDSLEFSSGSYSLETLFGVEEVPEGKYFVLGDNRSNSTDSRLFGFVDEESVLGKVSLRYWPLDSFGLID